MDLSLFFSFAAAFFVFAASPGPDNMTIVARTVSHGPLSGLAYGLGTVCGILVYLALAVFGLSLLAQEMGTLMVVLRYLGGAYLVWMAYRLWTAPAEMPESPASGRGRDFAKLFLTGMALNLGNPKMPLFYVALLPNFVGGDFSARQFLTFVTAIVAVEIIVIGGHIGLARKARAVLKRPAMIRRANRSMAVLFFGAGIAALATQRGR